MDLEQINRHIGFSRPLTCPECGEEYNHPVKVGVVQADDDYVGKTTFVEADGGIYRKDGKYPFRARGGETYIMYECEFGHRWALVNYFHKGRSFQDKIFIENIDFEAEHESRHGQAAGDVEVHGDADAQATP